MKGDTPIFLEFDGPLALAPTLSSGMAFRWCKIGDWWHAVLRGHVFSLRQVTGGIEFRSTMSSREAAALLHSYLRLDDDLEDIYQHLIKDSRTAAGMLSYRGMRIIQQEPWECLVSFICSIHSNIPRITRTVEAIAQTYGEPINFEGVTWYTFPTPSRLAQVGELNLRRLGLGFRAPYVARTAYMVAHGNPLLEAIEELPYAQAKENLMILPGVGPKVADCVLLFSLGKLEAFPVDLWVRRALEEWYGLGPRWSYRRLETWARTHFSPCAGYACQYLFHGRRLQGKTNTNQV